MRNQSVKVSIVNRVFMIMTLLLTVVLIYIMFLCTKAYTGVQDSVLQYIACEEALKDFKDSSNFLTEQSRLYTYTADSRYMFSYIEEVISTRRRERALSIFINNIELAVEQTILDEMLRYSTDLEEIELLAMNIVASAEGIDPDVLPVNISSKIIDDEILELSKSRKKAYAQTMLSSTEYKEIHDKIMSLADECSELLLHNISNKQIISVSRLTATYGYLCLIIVVFLITLHLYSVVVSKKIAKPLVRFSNCIRVGEALPEEGVAELRELAQVYNKTNAEYLQTLEQTKIAAEIDALTGIYNRFSFEKFIADYNDSNNRYGIVLVDIDKFKEINDSKGHAAGDKALQKVAIAIKSAFNGVGHACRIGGDEFAVIVPNIAYNSKQAISDAIDNTRAFVNIPEVNTPTVTISVGVSIMSTSMENKSKIIHEADLALYKVKATGRNGTAFYE